MSWVSFCLYKCKKIKSRYDEQDIFIIVVMVILHENDEFKGTITTRNKNHLIP